MASLDGNLLGALLKLAAVAGCCGLSEALPRAAAPSIHHPARRPPNCMANGGECHCGCGCASERHLTPRASGVWLAAVAALSVGRGNRCREHLRACGPEYECLCHARTECGRYRARMNSFLGV